MLEEHNINFHLTMLMIILSKFLIILMFSKNIIELSLAIIIDIVISELT